MRTVSNNSWRRTVLAFLLVAAGFVTVQIAVHYPTYPLFKTASYDHGDVGAPNPLHPVNGIFKHVRKPAKVSFHHQKDKLFHRVQLLCWVMTNPKNLATKAQAVKETWGPRCNKLLFMSSEEEPSLPAIGLPVKEGRENLWEKSRLAWYYAYKHYGNDYDWYLKADDDAFVIAENFRYFASQFNPEKPHYLGRIFLPFGQYASGGAGYAVSRAALQKLGPTLETKEGCQNTVGGVEDIQFGNCLRNVGVHIEDTRDGYRHRFHPFVPEHHLIPNFLPKDFWYWKYTQANTTNGPECCSDITISFHYISPQQMRELFFYVYRLHPYGYYKTDDLLPLKKERTG